MYCIKMSLILINLLKCIYANESVGKLIIMQDDATICVLSLDWVHVNGSTADPVVKVGQGCLNWSIMETHKLALNHSGSDCS